MQMDLRTNLQSDGLTREQSGIGPGDKTAAYGSKTNAGRKRDNMVSPRIGISVAGDPSGVLC